ncbi:MAG: OmpA family protein [Bacteroidota bacterium]
MIIVVFALSGMQPLFSQNYYTTKTAPEKAQKAYKESREYAFKGDLQNSRKAVEKALKIAPTFIEALYLLTDIDITDNNLDAAEAGFRKIIELAPDHRPKVFYSYGVFLWEADRFEEAVMQLTKFLTYPQKSESLQKRATRLLSNAEFAAIATKNPVAFAPKNMGPHINSLYPEYWPSMSVDGSSFIFTRNTKRNEDFFVSKKSDGIWEEARNIGPPINTPLNEGAQTISADGKYFAYTVCNRPGDFGKCDIYYSELVQEKWTMPQNIGAPINSPLWESQPSLSADGQTLFFVRGSDNRASDKDIWVSVRQEGNNWSKPEKLGTEVNTPLAEDAPFIHPDGQTLYFVSDGHPGMGKSDIYLSKKQPDGHWGKAVNIGYPINTKGEEPAIFIALDGKKAYFASDRKGGYGSLDLYEFDLPENARPEPVTFARAMVFDMDSKTPLIASVNLKSLADGQQVTLAETDENGIFLVCLPMGTDYALEVEKKGYLFHSENFALKGVNSLDNPYELEIGLVKIPEAEELTSKEEATPVVLKNVFFESGSADLKPESVFELTRLKELLDDYPEMNIQINGHTDNVGSEEDNLSLSENRAKAVTNFLVQAGIAQERLQFKGFGETIPVDTNDTPEGRANNRRTEFIVID